MPYSSSYLIHQLARGRPFPVGSPDPELHRALSHFSPLAIEEALHQGARADTPDPQGRSLLHALFDHAGVGQPALRVPVDRLMACCRALLRQGGSVMAVHPRTRETVLGRTAALASHPQAHVWWHFWRGIRQGDWNAPQGAQRQSALAAWVAHASPDMQARLPVVPGPIRPRRSP